MSILTHGYDFQDNVYITTQGKGGLVKGIRQGSLANQWLYQVTTTGDRWWFEEDLTYACPNCLSSVAPHDNCCPSCGAPLIDD